jgi:2-keto-3-deoxy-L-rhamnonate aldolase RhmA
MLKNGGKSYGPFLMSDSPIVAQLLACMGYSHIVIDHEHACTDIRSGLQILDAIESTHSVTEKPTEPIVRLPSADPVYMKKVLDTLRLPAGVLVPMVEDVATAELVVRSTRYPSRVNPDGIRGSAYSMVRASSYGCQQDYLRQCQEDLFVMVQVESKNGVKNIRDIAKVDGIDAIFIGPLDLSASIGKMAEWDDAEFQSVLEEAQRAVRESDNCLLAGFRTPGTSLEYMFGEAGYSFVCGSVDLGMLQDAARKDVQIANEAMTK